MTRNCKYLKMSAALFFFFCLPLGAGSSSQEILHGEVAIDLEPVYLARLGEKTTIDTATASMWALEECAAAFSGIIYGWEFEYEPGERGRQLSEKIALSPLGKIESGDPRIKISSASIRNNVYYLWCDFELSVEQQLRVKSWNSQGMRERVARGYSPLEGPEGAEDKMAIKQAALEDAIKKTIRAALSEKERNRPRLARGRIALSAFPVYRIFSGNWAAQARFRVDMLELVPFPVY